MTDRGQVIRFVKCSVYFNPFIIFGRFMTAKRTSYRLRHHASAVFMICTLLWLTVSTPLILDAQRELSSKCSPGATHPAVEESTNPFAGLNEEKSSTNALSEYLHEPLIVSEVNSSDTQHGSHAGTDIYIAYYGELISPPPEV